MSLLQYLIETQWLEDHLKDPDLRVIDCTALLNDGNGGREAWIKGHIPGSGYVDLVQELSDLSSAFPFMMPPTTQFVDVMSRLGIDDGKKVVLYDSCEDKWAHIWAARVWWMLRAHGFKNAALLNGGLYKWKLEKRPLSTAPFPHPPSSFVSRFRPELIADKQEVLAATQDGHACLINALTEEEHAGKKARYGRAGHIPTSVNVPTVSLIDPKTHAYFPPEELKRKFEWVGAFDHDRIITYCGGGIAASSDAFVLTLLGKKNVAVYDGSLLEWSMDMELPMKVTY